MQVHTISSTRYHCYYILVFDWRSSSSPISCIPSSCQYESFLVSLLLALAVSLTQGQRFRTDGCPEPYDRFDETRCILTDPFVNRNYATALAFCKAHGGKLVHFDNCFDQILLYDYLHTEVGLAEHSYWLGATDEAEEGVWIWEHNKQPVPMGNPFWENGEPSITTNFNCGYLHTSFSHRWFDAKCDGGAKTICFRDA